jgi:hypothetical protein
LDINGLIEQAAHKLDVFIENRNLNKVSALTRELLIKALVTQLEMYSSNGMPISKDNFFFMMEKWIAGSMLELQHSINHGGIRTRKLTLDRWMNVLLDYEMKSGKSIDLKAQLKYEVIHWIDQLQPAKDIMETGLKWIEQRKPMTKREIWQYYCEAKRAEEILNNIEIPIVALQSHIAYRESVRFYRRAIGKLYEFDTGGFSREMDTTISKTKEATKLFEQVKTAITE